MSPYPADELKRLEGRPEAAWLWDAERGRMVWANRSGLAFWGELTLLDLLDRRFPADMPAVRRIAGLGRDLAGGETVTETLVFHPREGERIVTGTCSAIPLDDGRTGVLVVEAVEAEAGEATERARLLEAAMQALPVALAVFDRHGSLVFQNAACRETFDAEAGEGSVLAAWMGDASGAEALIERGLALGSASEAETLQTRFGPRAQRLTLRRIAAPIHGQAALLLAFEDIEDRRRIERQRERDLARLDGYLDAAADVTFEIDAQRRLTDLGGRVTELFGIDAASLIGLDLEAAAERLALALPERALRRLSRLARVEGTVVLAGADREEADEGPRAFVLAACPAQDASGAVVGLRGTLLGLVETPEAASQAGQERGEAQRARPWPPAAGSDDVATFSEIGRAVAANAEALREARRGGAGERPVEPEDGGVREVPGEGAAHRLVAAMRKPAEPGEQESFGEAALPAPRPALRRPDAGDLDATGEPVLVHRGFEILYASGALASVLGHPDQAWLLADRNLLNLFPDERARLFSLQNRFDDGDLAAGGGAAPVPLKAKTAARGTRTLMTRIEPILFGDGPAVLMRFEELQAAAPGKGQERRHAASPAPIRPPEPPPAPPVGEIEIAGARASESELREVLDAAADGIATLDAAGNIVMLNASAEAIFGVSAENVGGRPLSELFTEDSGRIIAAYLQSLTEDGSAGLHREGRELEGRRHDGSTIPLFLTVGRMRVDHGPRFCVVVRDISQWKRAEADLRAAKEAAETASSKKSDFLAKISHELRTPLNAIIGFSEMMSAEKFGPIANDRYRGYLADIRTSGQHLLGLINDLLDLSKVEAGKLDLNFASVDMVALVQQCVGLMQPEAAREEVIMRTSLPDHLPNVVADERAMRQVMLNLLSNAIKFTPQGGQVILSALMDEEGRLQIRVRDTGVGMSAEELARAMEPFRQIEQAVKVTSLSGTGLGLPLTRALVEANRAEFHVESTPNAGTLVQVIFPSERVLAG